MCKATDDYIRLLETPGLEAMTRGEHAKKPLSDVICMLISEGNETQALKLKVNLKVPEKRYLNSNPNPNANPAANPNRIGKFQSSREALLLVKT